MNKVIFIIVLITAGVACSVQNEFNVTRTGEEPEKAINRMVYVLPQTVIKVQIYLRKNIYIPGPYNTLAPIYLGIKETIDDHSETWELISVKMGNLVEPDPSQYYSVNIFQGKPDFSGYFDLTKQGLIINPVQWMQNTTELSGYPEYPKPPYYTDLSVYDYFREVTDTLYKTIITDTSFIRVPIPRRQREPKTLEQKAEEAAGFILHLRETRFDLLSGESDVLAGGNALEFAINELNRLEQCYLELFTGKKTEQVYSGTIFLTPDGNKQQFNIIKLLTENGHPELAKYDSENILLDIIPLQKLNNINISERSSLSENVNHLIYRIPDVAIFKVTKGNKVYYEERASLYQAGKIMYLPVMF